MSASDYDALIGYVLNLPDDARSYVMQDVPRWKSFFKKSDLSEEECFGQFFQVKQEFRSVVRYRLKMLNDQEGFAGVLNGFNRSAKNTPTSTYVPNLYLSCRDIGPGLFLEHAFSTIVYAKAIGRDFWINQGVTIGTGRGGHPTIGDNVSVRAGAIVFGNIRIGNNVRIGAGAVVNESIPDNATVVPQKARIILRD